MIFQMYTNFRLARLGVDMVGGGWVVRWGEAECSAMWYDAKRYVTMQWEVEKTVKTLFKLATYVASYEPRSISYRPRLA